MAEYVNCPNCETLIPLKRKSDEFARASSLPPETTWKKRCLDVEGWKLNPMDHVFDGKKGKVFDARWRSPEPNKRNSDGDSGGSDTSIEEDYISLSPESRPISKEHEIVDFWSTIVDKGSSDVDSRKPNTDLADLEIHKQTVDIAGSIADAKEADNIKKDSEIRGPGTKLLTPEIHKQIIDIDEINEEAEEAEKVEEIIEAPDSVEERSSPKIPPKLIEKFLKREFPSIAGDGSLGNLVENFQKANPNIDVVNLYDLPYNVHSIKKYKPRKEGKPCFLVHWEGWSSKSDTWEAEETIKRNATPSLCLHISHFFLQSGRGEKAEEYLRRFVQTVFSSPQAPDYLVLSKLAKEKLPVENDCVIPKPKDFYREKLMKMWKKGKLLTSLHMVRFANIRLEALERYRKWFEMIARKEPQADIDIENFVDCEDFPSDFVYITDHIVSEEVKMESPKKFCKCENRNCLDDNCCGRHPRHPRASVKAYRNGRLTNECSLVPLYECNSKCGCGFACSNRLIQHGARLTLTIFKTVSRGWGVKARTSIPKGTFVGEYLGELMTSTQAMTRQEVNFAYLFDLMPIKGKPSEYTIDAAKFGNFTRFFNHSCEPNLRVSYFYKENHNIDAPGIAFFAKKDISCGEELTFDYHMQITDGSGHLSQMKCLCAAPKCRKLLF